MHTPACGGRSARRPRRARAEPAKRRPGYANFAIAESPLKLVLTEGTGAESREQALRSRSYGEVRSNSACR
ncbi:hypothetical protein GCM10023196_081120 [Actinoallomurus vinaceus]|uniref:Uncharacterized protein n=1 Tax=Actinoallomurus vinaceus TaxID=1080074 RepID=A0ABP8UPZ1_9ACTN